MAATIAECIGHDRSREKEDHRLGSEAATGKASTWETFAIAHVKRDGSGYLEVKRNGRTYAVYFNAEGESLKIKEVYDTTGA